jgi:hypothetical protein
LPLTNIAVTRSTNVSPPFALVAIGGDMRVFDVTSLGTATSCKAESAPSTAAQFFCSTD